VLLAHPTAAHRELPPSAILDTAPPPAPNDSPTPLSAEPGISSPALEAPAPTVQKTPPELLSEPSNTALTRFRGFLRFLLSSAPEYSTGTWLFLRLLALCHLIAFASLLLQLDGLIGEHGIIPAGAWLEAVHNQLGADRFWQVPTLCWLDPSDAFRHSLCLAGIGFSLAALLGVATRFSLAALWLLYLSLCTVGGVFFWFQWDALLLEATLFSLFLAPAHLRPSLPWGSHAPQHAPPRVALAATWWLIARLMLLSGAVKLLSHDALWRDLSALTVHFQTQPLPTPVAWWLHQMPPKFLTASCAAMFAIELGLPFFILAGRLGRRTAALGFSALMALIALSGNYCFFNLLVLALSLTLLDNAFWQSLIRKDFTPPAIQPTASPLRPLLGALLLAPLLWASALQTFIPLFQIKNLPSWATASVQKIAQFRSINGYGLFAVMTPKRPEIILEGSADGRSWKEYSFKWKPGTTNRPLPIVAPHQPRLDWHLWFAALGEMRHNPWFSNLLVRVLQGEPSVLALFEHNPFPDSPPRFIRAALFQYKFTDRETRQNSGQIWERDYRGDYCPPISLSPGASFR